MAVVRTAGFSDPGHDSQRVFRDVMMALARPASVRTLAADVDPPSPLTRELAGVALALADHDAPVWLDDRLAAAPEVRDFLTFHTGAAIVDAPGAAAFALVCDPDGVPDFETLAQGSDDYPDRSTTLVVAVDGLEAGNGLRVAGPGVRAEARLAVTPPLPWIADILASNHTQFPRGLDVILVAPGTIAGLPRSLRAI